MGVTFQTARGGNPATFILDLVANIRPTIADALYAVQRQRTRIVDRTINGVDVDGHPFEPYDTTRPYYYYPQGPGHGYVGPMSKAEAKKFLTSRKRAVSRVLKITGDVANDRAILFGDTSVGGTRTRSGVGIRFDSYADFKTSLGRSNPDLLGPRAPHMLQAIEATANGEVYGTSAVGSRTPVEEFGLGIYGDAAKRANAHNTGFNPKWKRRHQRHFLGASADDVRRVTQDLLDRIKARIR